MHTTLIVTTANNEPILPNCHTCMSSPWSRYLTLLCGSRPFHLHSWNIWKITDSFSRQQDKDKGRTVILQFANQGHADHWSKWHVNHHQRSKGNAQHVLQQHDQTSEKEAHPCIIIKIWSAQIYLNKYLLLYSILN